MPQVNVVVPHSLSPDEAVRRIKADLEEFQVRFANTVSEFDVLWDGLTAPFTITVFGFSGSGTLEVTNREVRLSGELPFKAILFRGRVEELFKERLEAVLK